MQRGLMALAALLGAALPVLAQESNDDLRKEVEKLKGKVEALEAAKAAPAPAKEAQMMDLNDTTILDTLLADTTIHGFVDSGFVFNIDRPNNGTNGALSDVSGNAAVGNSVRAFDRDSRSFYLHNAQLNIARAPTKELIVGYNIEVSMGSDANTFGTLDSSLTDFFDIQEANVQILAPLGNGLTLTMGKFATFAGYEVIEAKDNYNYSRSLPFLFAIPFTHTGVRATYSFSEQITATIGVNNGWDVAVDNNDAKTLEFNLTTLPVQWLKFLLNFYYGAEKTPGPPVSGFDRDDGDKRMLVDLILTIQDIPGLPGLIIGLNYDFAEESDSATSATGTIEDAEWSGLAFYLRYQFNPQWAGAFRYSMIDDENLFRTTGGAVIPTTTTPARDLKIDEFTFTVEYSPAKGLKIRLEFRMDSASEDIFRKSDTQPTGTAFEDSQSTIGAEVIVEF